MIRTKNNGHFVDDETIKYKWKEGYRNINLFYNLVDNVVFIDNSINNEIPKTICEIRKVDETNFRLIVAEKLPTYLKHRIPSIFDLVANSEKS